MSELYDALYKKALGYTAEEEVREYGSEDELIKRKVTVKNVPPDTAAAKAYLEIDPGRKKYESMSTAELKKEAAKLYKEIKEIKGDGCKEN
jgi:hypothetical protein